MGFADKWLVGTVAVLSALSVVVPFVPRPAVNLGIDLYGAPDRAFMLYKRAENACRKYYELAHAWRQVRGRFPTSVRQIPFEYNGVVVDGDPWGARYWLERDGDDIRIRSPGPDGRDFTEDDVYFPRMRR